MKKLFLRVGSILLITFLSFCNLGMQKAYGAEDIGEQIKKYSVPLKTVQPEESLEDLNKIKDALKDKQIIALGEAVYATKEALQMKHRLFRFLVEEMDCKIFAMEASFEKCSEVNDYILGGDGNVREVVRGMKLWTWTSEEVVDMVQWMREYNLDEAHKQKIKFYGLDVQHELQGTLKFLKYIKKVDEPAYNQYKEGIDLIERSVFDEDFVETKGKLNDLRELFKSNRDKYIAKSSEDEFELQYKRFDGIYQYTDHFALKENYDGKYKLRNYYMAQNAQWILNHEKKHGYNKMMISTHNSVISQRYNEKESMGKHLRDQFGDKYYALAFELNEGYFNAMDYYNDALQDFQMDKSSENEFAGILNKAGNDKFFMDFNTAAQSEELNKILTTPQRFHSVVYHYNVDKKDQYIIDQVPKEEYDGIMFIQKTHPSSLIVNHTKQATVPKPKAPVNFKIKFILIGVCLPFILVFIMDMMIKKKNMA